MARTEADKEDLIVEATALVPRAEFSMTGDSPENINWKVVTVGFRRDDCLSLYFEQNPFYQFDSSGKLRRAWEDNFLFRSTGSTLAKLHRSRTAQQTLLERVDLSEAELNQFQGRMFGHVNHFLQKLIDGQFQILRVVPHDAVITSRLIDDLQKIVAGDAPFLSATIRSRK